MMATHQEFGGTSEDAGGGGGGGSVLPSSHKKAQISQLLLPVLRVLVAQWVKRWPTDLADRVRSLLEVKSFQP